MADRRERRTIEIEPKNSSAPSERGLWETFKSWLVPTFRETEDLTKRAGKAEVAKREAEAEKAWLEVAEARLRVVKETIELANRTNSPDDSEDMKDFKRAIFVQAYPEIEDALREVKKRKRELEEKGAKIRIIESE